MVAYTVNRIGSIEDLNDLFGFSEQLKLTAQSYN